MNKPLSAAVTIIVSALFVLLSLAAHAAQPAPPIGGLCDHTAVAGGHVMAWVTSCTPVGPALRP